MELKSSATPFTNWWNPSNVAVAAGHSAVVVAT
jgi:hypothetical protein